LGRKQSVREGGQSTGGGGVCEIRFATVRPPVHYPDANLEGRISGKGGGPRSLDLKNPVILIGPSFFSRGVTDIDKKKKLINNQ